MKKEKTIKVVAHVPFYTILNGRKVLIKPVSGGAIIRL